MQSYEEKDAGKVCVNCGSPVEEGSVFCDTCGWKHGDVLPGTITEQDIRRWNNLPEMEVEEQPEEPKSHLHIFIPTVIGISAALIAGIVALYILVIKPEILDRTEQIEQEEMMQSDLTEVLENNMAAAQVTEDELAAMASLEVTPSVEITPTPTTAPVEPTEISYKFVELTAIDKTVYPRFTMNNVASMTSSSEYVQENVKNHASYVFDGNEKTSWQEGVEGDGIGQSITCQLNRQYQIRYFGFKLGNWRDEKYYAGNGKPKTLTVELDGYLFTFAFPEEKKEYVIELSEEIPATTVTVTIDSVYKGAYWDDTCITEFNIYGY